MAALQLRQLQLDSPPHPMQVGHLYFAVLPPSPSLLLVELAAIPWRPGNNSERSMTEASDLWFERVEKAIRDLNQVLEEQRRVLLEQAGIRTQLLRAAAVAALVLSSASYAQAYDYVDARGYRHWCHQAGCADRKNKVVDENDLSWEPPPGVKWQVIDDRAKSAQVARD